MAAAFVAGRHDEAAGVGGGGVVGGVPVVPRPPIPGAGGIVRVLGGRCRGLALRALPIRPGEGEMPL